MIPKPIAYLAQESNSPTQARRAINAGFKTVALQLGLVTAEAIQVARDAGLFVAVWGPVGRSTVIPANAQAFIPQVEGPGQRDGAIAALDAGVGRGLEKAIVTTYSGLEQGQYADLARRGVTECQVECYKADGWPHHDVDRMLSQGEVYGIPRSALVAVVGTYAGEYPDAYPGLAPRVPNYGIYIIEQTGALQLAQFGILNADATPPAPVIPNPADVNARINTEAHTWLDCFPDDPKPLSRLRAIARIARTTDTQWVNARARVVGALDDVGASQG